jgi:hypothetical protein
MAHSFTQSEQHVMPHSSHEWSSPAFWCSVHSATAQKSHRSIRGAACFAASSPFHE